MSSNVSDMDVSAETLSILQTPSLLVDQPALLHNIDVMARTRPGFRTRPHVKAFKSTDLARFVKDHGGHDSFCAATLKELEGMVSAGLDEDLLLANETLDMPRLRALQDRAARPITVAVDSEATIEAAAYAGVDVLIDVNVGLPRCGCTPTEAPRLAEIARSKGLTVRGVMGYEGHVVGLTDRHQRIDGVTDSMAQLREAWDQVGGQVISVGGTGTFDLHDWATEVQAGSYLLMDTSYQQLDLPFRQALFVLTTVISRSADWAVVDGGLKAFAMDHGNPRPRGYETFFCSDEHTTIVRKDDGPDLPQVGEPVLFEPAHIDPTVALHERMLLIHNDRIVDEFVVDLRNW